MPKEVKFKLEPRSRRVYEGIQRKCDDAETDLGKVTGTAVILKSRKSSRAKSLGQLDEGARQISTWDRDRLYIDPGGA